MEDQAFTNHYKIMGITRDSTEAQIRKAYKNMSLKHHPDKHNNSEASTIAFQKLNEANCILSDPDRRYDYNKLYDQHLEWTLRGTPAQNCTRKRKAGDEDDSEMDDAIRKTAANFRNKRAREEWREQEIPETHGTGNCYGAESTFARGCTPRGRQLWTDYIHEDIRYSGCM